MPAVTSSVRFAFVQIMGDPQLVPSADLNGRVTSQNCQFGRPLLTPLPRFVAHISGTSLPSHPVFWLRFFALFKKGTQGKLFRRNPWVPPLDDGHAIAPICHSLSTKRPTCLHPTTPSCSMNRLCGLERLIAVTVELAMLLLMPSNASESGCEPFGSWSSTLPRSPMSFNQ